jgi:hypothetical protein
MNVVELKTHPMRDQENMGALLKDLNDAYDRGEVRTLLWAYCDKDGQVFSGVSDCTRMGQFAYKVAVLQERLMRWIAES